MSSRIPMAPALRQYLDDLAANLGPMPSGLSDAQRVQRGRLGMLGALKGRDSIPGLPNNVTTGDVAITPQLTGRLYLPANDPSFPVMVYLHGGGWVVGSVETHDPFCRLLAEAAGIGILSVEYRLAPEHPCPAGLEDAVTALRWAEIHVNQWGGDPTRLLLGGDSAGANLAAVVANQTVSRDIPALSALMLLYPVTEHHDAGHHSYIENGSGNGLDAALMRWFWQLYTPSSSARDPLASPIHCEKLPALPPTLVTTAGYDVLRDEGIAYVQKLSQAGVAVTHIHTPDMHHNFPVHPGTVARFPQSIETLKAIAGWLKRR